MFEHNFNYEEVQISWNNVVSRSPLAIIDWGFQIAVQTDGFQEPHRLSTCTCDTTSNYCN